MKMGQLGSRMASAIGGCCVAALVALPGAASAQSLGDKYWIEVDGFWPDVDSKVQVANVNRPNIATNIDLESDLDLSDRKVLPAVNVGAKFGRIVVAADYYSLHRSGSRTIGRTIDFDDVTFPVGVTVGSEFNTDIYRLTVGYNFINKPNAELGLAIGGHITDFEVALTGQATVAGATVLSTENRKKSVLAPLPTIGAYGDVEVVPRLMLSGRVDWLSLSIGDYKGRLWNAQGTISYRIFKNVSLGVAYRYVDYRLDVHKPKWTGSMTYGFKGPVLTLRAGF